MRKIIVIGSPGAGKSYFSKQLAVLLNKPLFHLDSIYWREDKTHIESEELVEKLHEIMSKEEWIIDGNYNRTMDLRVSGADTVIYMEYPVEVCLQGISERVGKKRDDIPWVEEGVDPEFEQFVRNFKTDSVPKIEAVLQKYPDKNIIRLHNREDADALLRSMQSESISEKMN